MNYRKPFICNIFAGIVVAMVAGFDWSCSMSGSTATFAPTPVVRSEKAININIASVDELERIPGLGRKLATEIVRFRDEHGPFRRPEHLLLIHDLSDRRYRDISGFVRTE